MQQSQVCAPVFFSLNVYMFLCCHDVFSFNGGKPVAALANSLPLLDFLWKINLIQIFSQPSFALHSCIWNNDISTVCDWIITIG